MRYVVVDVGCIECGESTSVVGVFDDRTDALACLAACAVEKGKDADEEGFGYFNGGQHFVSIYEVA